MSSSFGALLREHRGRADLTQEQLAAKALISSQAIGALERGTRRFPHSHTITRLADALGLDGEQRAAFAAAAARPSKQAINDRAPDSVHFGTESAGEPRHRTLPRQMPPPTTLIGRDAMASEIVALLCRTGSAGGHTALLVGPGGIGKTALALSVGHLLADFTDGQLFADLRGTHEQPADPHAVLGRFLRALGVPAAEVPLDPDERLAAYRSLLAGRRMLLLLDDAASEEQVRPLLPPTGDCATMVTSRWHLGALLGTARWTVPALGRADALELLARIAGTARITAERAAAAQVVDACGYSPLAICVAAGRLAVRPDWTVAELGRRLSAEYGRLDALSVGDLDVRASIGLSYQALSHAHQMLFRRLGLMCVPDWPAWLTDELCPGPTEPLLDELVNVHLVEPTGVDAVGQQRFRLHDLVAEFARERLRAEESAEDLDQLEDRLLRAWLALASVADDAYAHGYEFGTGLAANRAPDGPAATVRAAPVDWFEAERATLVAAVGRACRLGRTEVAGAIALRLAGFLRVRSHRDDRIGTLREAFGAVRAKGPARLRLRLAQTLISVLADLDLDAEMAQLIAEALDWARALGDPELLVRALQQAGFHAKRRGRLGEAAAYYEQSLAVSGDMSPLRMSTTLAAMATIRTESGRPRDALPLSERAVAVLRPSGTAVVLGMRLLINAEVLADLDQFADAEIVLTEAMELFEVARHDSAVAYTRLRFGDLAMRRGRWEAAHALIHRAVIELGRFDDAGSVAYALRASADLALDRGRPDDALEPLRRELDTWRRLRFPLEEARVHARLHLALAALGEPGAAGHRTACDRILRDLELDERALRLRRYTGTDPYTSVHLNVRQDGADRRCSE